MSKTNAMRILESAGIDYTAHSYDVDEEDLTGITVANKIGAEPESVFKTLVTTGDKTGTTIFCIPVTSELSLKKAAAVSGNKKIEMIKMKDLQPLTGYIRGGCSPVGMKKQFPTFIDETAVLYDLICVSAGVRGTQIKVSPEKLAAVTGAVFAEIS
ncbi:MAG: Cys-tRNA(Pro) deacylase [Ignavibacteriaceae bacterium]|nr:Cys-tRNA(Pro) deacylase [Ignavibacteriaceae bacterium]